MSAFDYIKAVQNLSEHFELLQEFDLSVPDPENSVTLRRIAASMLNLADAIDREIGTVNRNPRSGDEL